MITIDKYQTFLFDTKASIKLLTKNREKIVAMIDELEQKLVIIKEAQEIMNMVGILAQDDTKQVFEGLVTQAVQAVFGDEYTFELESRVARGKPEIELFIVENGTKYSPKDEKGGGLVDIISFALRIVSWAIREPRSQNTLILDEPFRCLHKEVLSFLSEMMQKISEELGLQIICITHENQIAVMASFSENNKAFYVRQINGKSTVTEVKNDS
jgi:predicted ATPase